MYLLKERVFVTRKLPGEGLRMITENFDTTVWPSEKPPSAQEIIQNAEDCEGLVTLLSDPIGAEVIDKLPRFKPEKDKFHISKEEAIEKFKSFHKKGYIGTIWYGMYPYISNLCACATPACAGIRPRVEFDIRTVFKAEYVASINPDQCQGCQACIGACKFNAINFNEKDRISEVDIQKCYGCGVCVQKCKFDALSLRDRKSVPEIALEY